MAVGAGGHGTWSSVWPTGRPSGTETGSSGARGRKGRSFWGKYKVILILTKGEAPTETSTHRWIQHPECSITPWNSSEDPRFSHQRYINSHCI